MKINCVFVTNCNAAKKAWEFSRPLEAGVSDLNKITALDLPVNEFANCHIEIESTIIEREIFATLRNHVIWAQTSRVQNVLEFEIEGEFSEYSDIYEEIRHEMKEMSKTSRQDDYRLSLPLVSKTKYSISISIRNLIKVRKYFEYLAHIVENKNFASMFSHSAKSLSDVCKIAGYSDETTANYKYKKILAEELTFQNGVTSLNGEFIITNQKMPMHLRAQLIRHRDLQVKDNLFSILNNPSGHFMTLRTELELVICGDIEIMKEIISKRSCWVAQYNIWSDFLNSISVFFPNGEYLPCSGGACPFNQDAMLRYEGKDPNPPCPIHLQLNDLSAGMEVREKMFKMVKDDNRDRFFWGNEIQQVKFPR